VASRFLHNPAMGVQERLSGHTHAPLERLRTQESGLLGQETPVLHYGTPPPKRGMDTVQIKVRAEYLLHPTVAFPPARVNVGGGCRSGSGRSSPWRSSATASLLQSKRATAGGQARHAPGVGQQACPATLGVNMAESAGASQAWLVDVRRREASQRAECSMRAKETRRLAPGAAPRDVWAERPQTGALGPRPIALARPPARPPRSVTRAGTAKPVPFYGARRPGGQLPPVMVSAGYAQAPSPPEGEAPVAW
jgi:hypothetical protein